jgi:DNA repair protein RadD
VIAHRDVLTDQNMQIFSKIAPDMFTSVVNASQKDFDGDVVFAMIQTLQKDEHINKMPAFDLW